MIRTARRWGGALLLVAACSGERDKLLSDLQSQRPHERAVAVRELGKQGREEDLVLFTQAARDPAFMVRSEAVTALALSKDPRVVDVLGELVSDPDESTRARAAAALASFPGEKARTHLTLQYARGGRGTRSAIAEALRKANLRDGLASMVEAEARILWQRNTQALEGGTLPERVAAAEELGRSGRPEAVERLLPLLSDGQVLLAAAAARGLGQAGDPQVAGAIAELLPESAVELREAAVEALSILGEPAVVPRMRQVALEGGPASLRAVEAIAALPSSPAVDQTLCDVTLLGQRDEAMLAGRILRARAGCNLAPLVEGLKQPSRQPASLQAIAALGPRAADALPRVLPLLSHAQPQMRAMALEAVAEMAETSAAPAVLAALGREEKRVAAARADWVTRPPSTLAVGEDEADGSEAQGRQQELFRKVRERDVARAAEAGKVLVQVSPPTELIDDLPDEDAAVLAASLRAAAALTPEPSAVLKTFMKDAAPAVRAAALAGLAFRADPDACRVGLLDPDRGVQAAVAEAMAQGSDAGRAELLATAAKLTGDRRRFLEPLLRAGTLRAGAPALIQILKEGGPDTGLAARLLGKLNDPSSLQPLLDTLSAPDFPTRSEVLSALGQLGDARAIPALDRELYTDNPELRAAAIDALIALGAARERVGAFQRDYYRKARVRADQAMASEKPR